MIRSGPCVFNASSRAGPESTLAHENSRPLLCSSRAANSASDDTSSINRMCSGISTAMSAPPGSAHPSNPRTRRPARASVGVVVAAYCRRIRQDVQTASRVAGALSLPDIRYLLWPLPWQAVADTVRRSMTSLVVALEPTLRSSVRSRLELEAKMLALRHQLAILQTQALRRPRLGRADRVVWRAARGSPVGPRTD